MQITKKKTTKKAPIVDKAYTGKNSLLPNPPLPQLPARGEGH